MRLRSTARLAAIVALLATAVAASASEQKPAKVYPPKPPLPNPAALTARCAILIDETSGKVLFEKRADEVRYPASTTKILTALLVLEHCRPDDVVIAPSDIEKTGEASMHLKPGEHLSVRDLLWGIMLRSANDGCVAAARHVSGSVPAFAKLMNARAERIGCTNTHFNNPNGLNDPLHTTTARDLALIAREAMKNPEFRELVATRKRTIARSINQKDVFLKSKNRFLDLDPTADGIKTGFTRPAGQCFVGSATREGSRFITVVLGSEAWLDDTAKLMNWGFDAHEVVTHGEVGKPIPERAPLVDGQSVAAGPQRSARIVVRRMAQANLRELPLSAGGEGAGGWGNVSAVPKFAPDLKAPVKVGDSVGVLQVSDGSGSVDEVPLVALEEIATARSPSRTPYVLALGFVGLWVFNRRLRKRFYARF